MHGLPEFDPIYKNPHVTAEGIISRIEKLEKVFGVPSDHEAEQARRDELLQYVIVPPLNSG